MMTVLAMVVVVSLVQKKQAIATKMALILSIFLVLSLGYVYLSSDSNIKGVGDAFDFVGVYFSWMGSFFENLRTITAQVIKLDWSANNSTPYN